MKKIVIFGLFLCLSGCATPPSPPKPMPEFSPTMYFDNILDEKITAADPRIQSITGVYRDHPGSIVNIDCSSDTNNIQLANRLVSIFKTNQVTVDATNCNNNSISKVAVKIHFNLNESSIVNNQKGSANGDR